MLSSVRRLCISGDRTQEQIQLQRGRPSGNREVQEREARGRGGRGSSVGRRAGLAGIHQSARRRQDRKHREGHGTSSTRSR